MQNKSSEEIHESERRLIQKELFLLEDQKEAAEKRFQNMFENALVGLFRGDVVGRRLTDANLEAAHTFGFDTVDSLIHHVNTNRQDYSFFDSMPDPPQLSHGQPYSFSSKARRMDGSAFWAQFSVRYTEDGKYLEGAVKDITDQVKSMDRLRKAKAEADEANAAKSRFLATMSHEIRTPLNGIIGFAEILEESLYPENRDYARKILDESDRLMILINQLLDFSRLEARKISLENILFDLNQVLDETEAPLMTQMRQKSLEYTREIGSNVPRWFVGDPMRLRQVLTNLLSNAVKFTDDGQIFLNVNLENGSKPEIRLKFSVIDTGIGIPEDKIESIFASFEQADTSISRKYGGTGLGISICRELVNLMGGSLSVESREGAGSSFSFSIQMKLPPPVLGGVPALRNDRPTHLEIREGLRVLVVEDYDTNWEIARFHLEKTGCKVLRAGNGREAVEHLKTGALPDLILMDLHMPDMDGLEATRAIRSVGYRVPVIGMTASAYADDRTRCLEAGMNDFLTKPLRRADLLSKVAKWADSVTHAETGSEAEREDHPESHEGLEMTPVTTLRYNDLLDEMYGEKTLADELYDGFSENAVLRLNDAERALAAGDLERLHREAHSIKGGALNLMADDLAEKALALEKIAGAENGAEDSISGELQFRLDELKSAFSRFKAAWESIRENNETDQRQPGSL